MLDLAFHMYYINMKNKQLYVWDVKVKPSCEGISDFFLLNSIEDNLCF